MQLVAIFVTDVCIIYVGYVLVRTRKKDTAVEEGASVKWQVVFSNFKTNLFGSYVEIIRYGISCVFFRVKSILVPLV